MNTAAGLVTGSTLQAALQVPADDASLAMDGGDFAATLAAAGLAQPEAGMPEGMDSAAALAWLAGVVSAVRPQQLQSGTAPPNEPGDASTTDSAADAAVVPDSALSILQGMFAPVVPVPSGSAVEAAAALAATDAPAMVAAQRAAPASVSVLPKQPVDADAQAAAPASATGDITASAVIADRKTNEAAVSSNTGERLIGALVERASQADADRNAVTGPNPYASTRETVASAAGAVSTRPEVLHSTVGSPRWANELGSRLAMMSVRGQQEGSLSLTPEHLGPLEVRISVNQDTTNVWFGAQHADTRAALAEALPRLREMFAASGLALGQAGVSHEMPGQEARRSEAPAGRVASTAESSEAPAVVVARISSGLLDAWA